MDLLWPLLGLHCVLIAADMDARSTEGARRQPGKLAARRATASCGYTSQNT